MLSPDDAVTLAERALAARHPDAAYGFAAGSIVRGEATATSDLDLVVVYDALKAASRASFTLDGTPVETFIHDPETLAWAFRDEARVARCAMLSMVSESRICGSRRRGAKALQARARARLAKGPSDPAPLIAFAETALEPHGGWLFDGHESAWPPTNRVPGRRRS
jgi:hypothetical protein